MTRVLVIIVTYNAMSWIERCLGSVADYDVFLLDNGSSDGTAAYVREHYPSVKLRLSAQNLGFGKANNLGMEYALKEGYGFVYLLNQDAWLLPGTMDALLSACDSDPTFGILSPMQRSSSGSLDRNFGKFASPYFTDPEAEVVSLPFVMAAHWLISRHCLQATGLFSPVFPHYGEDENYCDRALYHGFKVGIVPGASAVHDRSFREESVELKLWRDFYTKSMVELSRVSSKRKGWLWVASYAAYNVLKYRTLKPLGLFAELWNGRARIASARKRSRQVGAFL